MKFTPDTGLRVQLHAPATSPHEQIPQYPQHRRLDGLQNWSFTAQTEIYNTLFVNDFLIAVYVDTQRRDTWPALNYVFIICNPKKAASYCWYYTRTATTMPQFHPAVEVQLLENPVAYSYQYSCNRPFKHLRHRLHRQLHNMC